MATCRPDGPGRSRSELREEIRRRRRTGELLADIGHDLGLTPLDVLEVLGPDDLSTGC